MKTEPLDLWHTVDGDRLRLLRDGREAFPAMLAAIEQAEREILLEMYWIGDDALGQQFREALTRRALAGVAVFVSYDGVGSAGMFRSFWASLVAAGGIVVEHGPIAPWRGQFKLLRLWFRDHRKLLVIDGDVAFCGGLNLAMEWLPSEVGGQDWRDDVVELRGASALALRALACRAWRRLGAARPAQQPESAAANFGRVRVLANHIAQRPNRRIRRAYLQAVRQARTSIDITNPYFLPGPLFLRALRKAHDRGVQVRLLVPRHSDVWLVALAMRELLESLVRHGIAVFAYERSILHAKTAVFDERLVIVGSHNLDALSWRFNLEANLAVDDACFAATATRSFERDLREATRLEEVVKPRSRWTSPDWLVAKLRSYL